MRNILNPLMLQFTLKVRMALAIIVCVWQHPPWVNSFPLKVSQCGIEVYHVLMVSGHFYDRFHIFFKKEKGTGKRELKQKSLFTLPFPSYNTDQVIKHSYQLSDHFCLLVFKFLFWDGKHSSNPQGILNMPVFI